MTTHTMSEKTLQYVLSRWCIMSVEKSDYENFVLHINVWNQNKASQIATQIVSEDAELGMVHFRCHAWGPKLSLTESEVDCVENLHEKHLQNVLQ